ncbi:Ketol-acid reductoisomerase (NADP(+)) [Dissostichus eleginoides]|uniref:Ketol-acid reductoisomerase (NADP(+)) n=1 Tax=Dissostichus eleginoides TaxID=100907 RepID=A0AAD9BV53_DISEL|nr:Ketol-acid reductoisomerase (NADP(+)) [Dissostichus eleginoides]
MGGKLSARRRERRNERQRTYDLWTHEDVLEFNERYVVCEDECSSDSGESSWTETEEKCYDPQDATLTFGECKFLCGQTDCVVEWPFEEVCKMALLTEEELEYFEKTLFSNAAKDYLDVKSVSITLTAFTDLF